MTTKEDKKVVIATIPVPVEISEQRIADMLCSAFDPAYGSSLRWAAKKGYEYPAGKTKDDFEYHFMEVVLAGGKMNLLDMNDRNKKLVLTREKLITGLQVMAALKPGKGGHHFPNFLKENDDAETADVYIQCCLFGEIIYD